MLYLCDCVDLGLLANRAGVRSRAFSYAGSRGCGCRKLPFVRALVLLFVAAAAGTFVPVLVVVGRPLVGERMAVAVCFTSGKADCGRAQTRKRE